MLRFHQKTKILCSSTLSLLTISNKNFIFASSPVEFTSRFSFRDNNNKKHHQSKSKTRKDQLDNIFKTRQKHASEKQRVLSMESEVREKPQMMMKQQAFIFPLLILFMGLKLPSVLTLYWAVMNIFMIVQQYLMLKKQKT